MTAKNFKTMKKIIVLVIVAIGFATLASGKTQDQVPYLSTKLSPYSGPELIDRVKIETLAEIETGVGDSLRVKLGTGKYNGNLPVFWVIRESSMGGNKMTSTRIGGMDSNIDKALNIRRDTIKHEFRGDTIMVAFEMIHHLSTGEIQYIWQDGDGGRSERAVFISLDPPLKVGKKFPDLAVEQLNGGRLSFGDLVGKVIVINWWATHCGPCIAEMPGLNKLVEQYPDVMFISIADNTKEQLLRFFEHREFNYIHTLGNEEVKEIFGNAYPVNVIVNAAGEISYYARGGYADKYREPEKVLNDLFGIVTEDGCCH